MTAANSEDRPVIRIPEIIVVEGRDDTDAIRKSVDAVTIETHGYGISKQTWDLIASAYRGPGIIVFTDPDHAGEQIRRRILKRFPGAKEAFLDREDATRKGDIGIENAAPEAIREALAKARCTVTAGDSAAAGAEAEPAPAAGNAPGRASAPAEAPAGAEAPAAPGRDRDPGPAEAPAPARPLTMEHLAAAGMAGGPNAAKRRAAAGKHLGIGYANCKTLLARANRFGITEEEFMAAAAAIDGETGK